MDSVLREKLVNVGVDIEKTLLIFMNNEGFYVKMLKKFPNDTTFNSLVEHMAAEDYETALRDAHTLKGLTANLGLGNLHVPAVELTECLRNEPRDIEHAKFYFEQVKLAYQEALTVVTSIE